MKKETKDVIAAVFASFLVVTAAVVVLLFTPSLGIVFWLLILAYNIVPKDGKPNGEPK